MTDKILKMVHKLSKRSLNSVSMYKKKFQVKKKLGKKISDNQWNFEEFWEENF